jgi:hypothetical protein
MVVVLLAGIGLFAGHLWRSSPDHPTTSGTPGTPATAFAGVSLPGIGTAKGVVRHVAAPFAVHPGRIRNDTRKVFAHYLPPFPLSLDNRPASSDYYTEQYLTVDGEHGKHAAYGGFIRDRPLPVRPKSGNWVLKDQEREVREAASVGINGFSVDLLSLRSENWNRTLGLLTAAHRAVKGFSIMAVPDMTTLGGQKSALESALATFAKRPAAFHLKDGRLVVSPFDAQLESPSWWSGFISDMSSTYHVKVALVPIFVGWPNNYASYASISYGFSTWGSRNPAANRYAADAGQQVTATGKKWMQPVSVQDERPDQGIYDEADNADNLLITWKAAWESHATWVQLTTWNDFSEGSEVEPSAAAGWSFLNMSSYYIHRFVTGKLPRITRDIGVVTYRTQPVGARTQVSESRTMSLRRGSSPARTDVQIVLYLKSAATVSLTVGGKTHTWQVPKGVHVRTVGLAVGRVSASISRGGRTIASGRGPYTVTDDPVVQDLAYHAFTVAARPGQ